MKSSRWTAGFTAAEMLITSAIASVVIGAAALGYSAIAHAQRNYATTATIYLGASAIQSYYNLPNAPTINTYVAPNYGSVARAEALREQFIEDSIQSIAVYCMYRNATSYNTVHPTTLPAPASGTPMDTSEGFRAFLGTAIPAATSVFNIAARNYGATNCYSIFCLGYSGNPTSIPVLAVYDVDVIPAYDSVNTATQIGNYASVKRFVAGTLSGYYDVYYPTGDSTDQFNPGVVAFERRSRLAVAEGPTIDPFKIAAEKPFYFIWWPDPSRDNIKLPLPNSTTALNADFAATDPRKFYNHMAGRTCYMFTIPLFPSS